MNSFGQEISNDFEEAKHDTETVVKLEDSVKRERWVHFKDGTKFMPEESKYWFPNQNYTKWDQNVPEPFLDKNFTEEIELKKHYSNLEITMGVY